MNRKLFIALLLFTTVGIFFVAENKSIIPKSKGDKKLQVVASFYPLYFFASQIGGNKVDVYNITPAGAEPHDYEPTTGDISRIESSDILVLNGGQLEPWGDKIKDVLIGSKVITVIAGEGLINQQAYENDKMILDPHIWLDPKLAQKEIATIAMAFEKFDNTNRVFYEKNAISLKNKLDVLDQGFRLGLLNCQQNNIVTSHAAFGYIASDYGLNQISVTGLSPDAEPSPQKMAEISQFAKTNQIKYIFFETLVSPRLADTIAGEIGAKTLVFNPLEGLTKDEQAKGWDYFSIQKENLANLKIALGCK